MCDSDVGQVRGAFQGETMEVSEERGVLDTTGFLSIPAQRSA